MQLQEGSMHQRSLPATLLPHGLALLDIHAERSGGAVQCSPMTRVVKVLTAAAKNKWKQRARRRQLRQRTGYDGPVNLPVGSSYRCLPHVMAI